MVEPTATLEQTSFRQKRRRELLTFVVLAFGIWPIVAVGTVATYGFAVWAYQIVYGPPGPHDINPARPNSAE
ncbi:periplasmic nitrate reductase, NapE protein [Aliirhizobium cellulosilyticum]|uniref:Nitrate reductase NapE n=1 Tax=Aliirhizobium cellulosilyticum TaxID=393664 RepID=A0A7W6TI35_9HYPH|nr:periplasmic nitrate reductase, NapE protein [Rhizobium cellulosilyticum]MBB4350669.1 nitrate reductase NapE [Rhizobium cellulosilyticum]MBB4413864.1 nitrate reductase NapE [Rhizobium cellulosilyticum]MBB4448479.1 nitrate reductase NapE [Rhizobium cellulosilyticum]